MLKHFSLHKLILDFFLVVVLGVGIILFKTVATPYQRGFYCDDESIRYPFRDSTITTALLGAVGVGIPVLTIFAFEIYRLYVESRGQFGFHDPGALYQMGNWRIHRFLVRIYIFVGYFLAGACMSQLLTDIGKYSIGRPRPHFVTVCNPDPAKMNCSGFHYVTENVCRGNPDLGSKDHQQYLMRESRLSFPSGHASFSAYCAIYAVLYIEARVPFHLYRPIFRPVLQFVYIALAVACAFSRVSDYKHHWSDVLSGSILGTFVAAFVGIHVAKLFRRRELPANWDKTDTEDARSDLLQMQTVSVMRSQSVEQLRSSTATPAASAATEKQT